ncbi:MAG: hydroxyphenylacetyl-CoA thioesterase PaaI [Gammaproteobacteria bacterium]
MSNADAEQQRALACAEAMYAEDHASRSLGMSIEAIAPGLAALSMTVRQDMVNGHGICHGGFVFTLADSACAFACNGYDRVTVLQGARIELVRPAMLGDRLRAEARELHRGARSGIYDVQVHRQDGKLVAAFRGNTVGTEKHILPEAT